MAEKLEDYTAEKDFESYEHGGKISKGDPLRLPPEVGKRWIKDKLVKRSRPIAKAGKTKEEVKADGKD